MGQADGGRQRCALSPAGSALSGYAGYQTSHCPLFRDNPEFYVVQEQQILGSERFAEKISLPRETPSRKRDRIALGFDELLARVSRATLVPPALITGRSRAESVYRARALLCYVATSVAGLPGRKVADALGRDPSTISRAVAWAERMTKAERKKFLQRIFGLG